MAMLPKEGVGRGVLHPRARAGKFQVERFHASGALAPYVEHYWTVSWDLTGEPPFEQVTLPHPSVHFFVERGRSELVGVLTGRFTRVLEGRGRGFGAKLRPGCFRPWVGGEVSRFTDRRLPLAEVFPSLSAPAVEEAVLGGDDARAPADMAAALQRVLEALEPRLDERALEVAALVDEVARDPTLLRVEALAARAGLSSRALQALFRRYVGVGPKWVLERYRLHEAADALVAGEPLADLSARLGYADQAHFTRAFRTVVGETPAAYARRNLERSRP